ncbi:MAG: aminoglycoside 6-adenylyltransferase [Clostridia bacterium]
MRSESEMKRLILNYASDESVALVAMNGSRVDKYTKKDIYQDYDIVFVVDDVDYFVNKKDEWLSGFGKRVIMQEPLPNTPKNATKPWHIFLMQFADGNRIDLLLVPIEDLDTYLSADSLTRIILDKRGLVKNKPPESDSDYWVKKPITSEFNSCINEFYWMSINVMKGILRNELLSTAACIDYMRTELLSMLSWNFGADTGFIMSAGKFYKRLTEYLSEEELKKLMKTYSLESTSDQIDALFSGLDLFYKLALTVAEKLGFEFPNSEAIDVPKYIFERIQPKSRQISGD